MAVRKAKPYKIADGGGMYLEVMPNGLADVEMFYMTLPLLSTRCVASFQTSGRKMVLRATFGKLQAHRFGDAYRLARQIKAEIEERAGELELLRESD
ncbi:hypothetical protein SAMN05216315_105115 [Nitrosospira sp. Nsp18]|uniref:Arm DNA-binding domain-containing protein n=1 Tax=Nitrosospira sp. Nsp18 TaxID=1855334 RepID=UPI0008922641|nr:Arm DNA-binding domain-containing protein [Nitrosospira sp. Nsp18]SDA14896.1 hypothetical protein SAMN05216315_105115 [Nitrosospira sp. Nsp18]